MTYSLNFGCKLLTVRLHEGLTLAQVAARFSVGIASVTRWLTSPEPKTSRDKAATHIDMVALRQDVINHPDAYQFERTSKKR